MARPAGRRYLYLTATSLADLLVGVEILPAGRRKEGIAATLAPQAEVKLFDPGQAQKADQAARPRTSGCGGTAVLA